MSSVPCFNDTLFRNRFRLLLVILFLVAVYCRVVPDMVQQWSQDENYSHGFLVPLIAAYFLYLRRDELSMAPSVPWNPGLLIFLFGLMQLVMGWLGTEYFTMRSSMVVVLMGLVLFLFGKAPFRIMALPLFYLFFMIPLPYIIYDAVAFPLKLFVTKVSVTALKVFGVTVLREGNIIMFPSVTLEVADACSGIRSLISLLALAVALAFFLDISTWKRWLLACMAIPIAIVTNAGRVIMTGFLAQYWGAKAAEGFFHEFAGFAVFIVAMALLAFCGSLLNRQRVAGDREN